MDEIIRSRLSITLAAIFRNPAKRGDLKAAVVSATRRWLTPGTTLNSPANVLRAYNYAQSILRAYTTGDYVADVEELRAHLGEDELNLLGHSHGGVVAMAYAAEQPGRVHSSESCAVEEFCMRNYTGCLT